MIVIYQSLLIFLSLLLVNLPWSKGNVYTHVVHEEDGDRKTTTSSHDLHSVHPSNRSDIAIFVNTTEKSCFIEDNLNAIVHYEFKGDIDPLFYSHNLTLNLLNADNEIVSERKYRYDQLNIVTLPVVDYFTHGVNILHLSLVDEDIQTTLDNKTLFFIQPCFPPPTLMERYFFNPIADHKPALVLSAGGTAVLGKLFYENMDLFHEFMAALRNRNNGPQPSLGNIHKANHDHQQRPSGSLRKFVNNKLIEANEEMKINKLPSPPPLPKIYPTILAPPPSSCSSTRLTITAPRSTETRVTQTPLKKPSNPLSTLLKKNRNMLKVVGLLSGALLFFSASRLSFDSTFLRTRQVKWRKNDNDDRSFSITNAFRMNRKLSLPTFPAGGRLFRDVKSFGKALSYSTSRKTPILPSVVVSTTNFDHSDSVQFDSKTVLKTVFAFAFKATLVLLQNWKLNNSNNFMQHAGLNEIPF
jgi:hypothetical protein